MGERVPFGVSLLHPTKTDVCCANISSSNTSGSRVTGTFLHGPARLLNHDAQSSLKMDLCSDVVVPQYLSTLDNCHEIPALSEVTWNYFVGQKNVSVEASFALWSSSACAPDFNRQVLAVSCFPSIRYHLRKRPRRVSAHRGAC